MTAWFVYVIVWLPGENLPSFKVAMLGVSTALFAGLFGYFLVGDMTAHVEMKKSPLGKATINATGGFGLFVFVLLWWYGSWSPTPKAPDEGGEPDTGAIQRVDGRVDGLWTSSSGQTYAFESNNQQVAFDGVDQYGYRIVGEGSLIGRQIEAYFSRGDGSTGRAQMTVSSDFRSMYGKATNFTHRTEQDVVLSRKMGAGISP
jgi:hypothetical protein